MSEMDRDGRHMIPCGISGDGEHAAALANVTAAVLGAAMRDVPADEIAAAVTRGMQLARRRRHPLPWEKAAT